MGEIKNKSAFPKSIQAFREFLIMHDPLTVSSQFRCHLLSYLMLNNNTTGLEEFLGEMYDFFELLDIAIEEEYGK